MADIANITNHPTDGYATLDCGPKLSAKLRHTPALWDRNRKTWLIADHDLHQLITWLRTEKVIVVVDSIRQGPPQPAPYQRQAIDWQQQKLINQRGVALARQALAQAPHQGAQSPQ